MQENFGLLSPLNDFVFKKLLSEDLTFLEYVLKSVLDLPDEDYKDLTVLDPQLGRDHVDDKLGVLDVKLRTYSGKIVNIEIQVRPQAVIWKRALFYGARMIVDQVKSGSRYGQINRAVVILMTDFSMITDSTAYHNRYRLFDENTKSQYPNFFEINIVELPKLKEIDGTPLSDVISFFKSRTEDEFMEVAERNPNFKVPFEEIKKLSGDSEARALAYSREKARIDMEDAMHEGLEKGREEGLAKGREEGLEEGLEKGREEGLEKGLEKGREEIKNSIAKNLLLKNLSHDVISSATGLSAEAVKKIASEISK
jgi:predicted transposase/invertase (TIGR01784 family)